MFFANDSWNDYEHKVCMVTSTLETIPNLFKMDPHNITATITAVDDMKGEPRKDMVRQLKSAIQAHVQELTVPDENHGWHTGFKYAL